MVHACLFLCLHLEKKKHRLQRFITTTMFIKNYHDYNHFIFKMNNRKVYKPSQIKIAILKRRKGIVLAKLGCVKEQIQMEVCFE